MQWRSSEGSIEQHEAKGTEEKKRDESVLVKRRRLSPRLTYEPL